MAELKRKKVKKHVVDAVAARQRADLFEGQREEDGEEAHRSTAAGIVTSDRNR